MFKRPKRSRIRDIRIMNQLFPTADAIAAADGELAAGAEHLLIAALDLDTGSARRAFEHVGADPDQFRIAVQDQHRDAMRSVGIRPIDDRILDQHIPPLPSSTGPQPGLHRGTPSSHELFRQVVALVRKDRSQLYGAYFVLVAAEAELGTTARALRHMNIEPSTLAAAARAEIDRLNTN